MNESENSPAAVSNRSVTLGCLGKIDATITIFTTGNEEDPSSHVILKSCYTWLSRSMKFQDFQHIPLSPRFGLERSSVLCKTFFLPGDQTPLLPQEENVSVVSLESGFN